MGAVPAVRSREPATGGLRRALPANLPQRRPPGDFRASRRLGAQPVRAERSQGIPMSEPLSIAAIGFCGKLPARGDFVTSGLPRRFTEAWHDWLQPVLAASRRALGEDWLAAWLEAPIWRFALSPGICGPDAVLGLWMPSVDRVGRYFPLTFAAVTPGAGAGALIRAGGAAGRGRFRRAGRFGHGPRIVPGSRGTVVDRRVASRAPERVRHRALA